MMESMINENLEGMNRIKEIALTLKDFAKPDQSQAELSDINKGIKDTLVIVSNHLKYVLDVTTEFEELSNLKCNIAQLNQVFLNLIINSAQAISEHRRETKGNLWIKTWVENNNMNIMFRDDGPGIPKDSQDKIFDAFMTTRKEGTGLGLSISYSIISAHKGKIRVESEEGSGTAFFIELPINNGL